MKRSTGRILTTHVGSLPRPDDLGALIRRKQQGETVDDAAFAARVESA
ncbi:MAG: epoxyalkane--coenzyme M transferase, partial [Alphaproteobacteria bacterium]|nr:epoxyalkane--coenzyme M transferase [Alphaproteobacteria bacterium]